MLKKIIKNTIKLSLFFGLYLFADGISFMDAWSKVIENSYALKAKKENINSAKFKQLAAKDLYWPDITLSANYVHLDKDMKSDLSDLGFDTKSLAPIVKGIAKSSSEAAYGEALKKGLPQEQATKIAQKTLQGVVGSFSSMQGKSFELLGQDRFLSSIRAVWPIFTGGRIEAANIVAKGEVKEALAVFEMAKQAQFEDLAHIYFGVVLAKEVAKTKKEVSLSLKKHYEHAQKLYKYGQIAKAETLLAKASYDKAVVDAKKAQKSYEIAQIALNNLLHVKTSLNTKTKLFTNKNLPKIDIFLDKTLSSYPGLELLKAKKVQTQGLVKANKGLYYPQVALFANYNLIHHDDLLLKHSPDWLVGVGVNVPLISSKGRSGKLDMAYSKSMQVDYMYEDAKRNLSVLVKKTYKQAEQALEEFNGLDSSIELGLENVRLREKSFSQGMVTALDVVDAQLFLLGVKTQKLVASYQYITSLVKLLAISKQIEQFKNFQIKE